MTTVPIDSVSTIEFKIGSNTFATIENEGGGSPPPEPQWDQAIVLVSTALNLRVFQGENTIGYFASVFANDQPALKTVNLNAVFESEADGFSLSIEDNIVTVTVGEDAVLRFLAA